MKQAFPAVGTGNDILVLRDDPQQRQAGLVHRIINVTGKPVSDQVWTYPVDEQPQAFGPFFFQTAGGPFGPTDTGGLGRCDNDSFAGDG